MYLINENGIGNGTLGCNCSCSCSCGCIVECMHPLSYDTNHESITVNALSSQSSSGYEHGRDA